MITLLNPRFSGQTGNYRFFANRRQISRIFEIKSSLSDSLSPEKTFFTHLRISLAKKISFLKKGVLINLSSRVKREAQGILVKLPPRAKRDA